jgi:uracil-DNA glycosylase family 4
MTDSPPSPPAPADANVLEPDCSRCPALAAARTCIAWGNGPLDAAVVVVGEAPSAGSPEAEEWRGGNHTGLAYTSRHSGRRVRALFEDVGIGDRVYYTNAVKCFPPDGEGSNREPTDDELANCRPHLARELRQVDPAAVVATGAHATRSVLAFEDESIDGFVDHVLDPVSLPSLGPTLVPILHPSYQDVWLSRLGYTAESYRTAIAETLASLGVRTAGDVRG